MNDEQLQLQNGKEPKKNCLHIVDKDNSLVGTRVKRERDWINGTQDYHFDKPGFGTISERRNDGVVRVRWDNGSDSFCTAGFARRYDLSLAFDEIKSKKPRKEEVLEWSSNNDFIEISQSICEKDIFETKESKDYVTNSTASSHKTKFTVSSSNKHSDPLINANAIERTKDSAHTTRNSNDHPVIMIDIETSSLKKACDILQIGLVDLNDESKVWSQYLQPTQEIDPFASAVNHITLENNKLCYRNKEIRDVVSPFQAIQNFKTYLIENYPDGVILLAHNGIRFDFRHIGRYLQKFDTKAKANPNKRYPIQCIDTLQVFKRNYPGEKSYSQQYILAKFLMGTQLKDGHEAVGDCINLKEAIKIAAKMKSISLRQFLGDPISFERFLSNGILCIIDNDKKRKKNRFDYSKEEEKLLIKKCNEASNLDKTEPEYFHFVCGRPNKNLRIVKKLKKDMRRK